MNDTKEVLTNELSDFMRMMRNRYGEMHPNGATEGLYACLISEEFDEWCMEDVDTPEDFKELCDLIWVCIMYSIQKGYPLEEGMAELMREFDSKFYDENGNYHPQYREDGKLLKGEGFKKANFKQFFEEK